VGARWQTRSFFVELCEWEELGQQSKDYIPKQARKKSIRNHKRGDRMVENQKDNAEK
jgi:hypothetical protein